jgi:deoxyribose-phosphate aldolase
MTQILTPLELAGCIEHRAEGALTRDRVEKLCREADELGFGAVSVPSAWVSFARRSLLGTRVKLSTTIGFPYGDQQPRAKFEEARAAVELGASEISFMLNDTYALDGPESLWQEQRNLQGVIRACCEIRSTTMKVLINVTTLTRDEFARLVLMVLETHVDFIGIFSASDGRHNIGIDPIDGLRPLIGNQANILVWNDELDQMKDGSSEGPIDVRHGFALSFLEHGAKRLVTTRGPGILHTARQLAARTG